MRRAQLLSMDALLSVVLVIMVVGVVLNTNDMIKAEITNVIDWYDRANIADSMLDVLVKSPGNPVNWEENPASVKVVGLRSENYSYALDYDKIEALITSFSNSSALQASLYNLSRWKDFQMDIYLTVVNVTINGSFAQEIYADLTGDFDNIKFALATDNSGNRAFEVECDSVKLNGEPSPYGQALDLDPGDVLEFITIDPAQVLTGGNERVDVIPDNDNPADPVPSGSYVQIVLVDEKSNYHYSFTEDNGVCELHIGGQGQVKLTVKGNSGANFRAFSNVTFPRFLPTPTSSLILVNGSVADTNTVNASRARSPWVQYQERTLSLALRRYNSTIVLPQNTTRIIAGKLVQNVPAQGFFEFTTTGDGNATFVVVDGGVSKGLMVWRGESSNVLKASLTWREDDEVRSAFYEGNSTSVKVPLSSVFDVFDTESGSKVVEVWLVENNFDAPLTMTDHGVLGPILVPKFEPLMIKLWVWDDS
ncbi:hypothetical protein [Palaeococcus ferrophilus]|uniref:hypothetical protein n=1 Tax=Palaeococcus ferrophilus TaxID=83868 RepID=UPI00064EC31E|nr:hypothetical protein [Palaeococcus ferrophilus]